MGTATDTMIYGKYKIHKIIKANGRNGSTLSIWPKIQCAEIFGKKNNIISESKEKEIKLQTALTMCL